MSWIATAAWIAASIAVDSSYRQARAERQAGEANQKIAENNARLDEAAAQDAANQGARESQQSAWRTRALEGQQRAAIAAAGLDSELGTPFDLQTDAALFGGADKSAIEMNAARKAWGFGASALNNRNQGMLANWQGKEQSKITILKGIGSAIGTVAGAYGSASSPGGTSSYGPYSSGYRYPSSGYGSGYVAPGGWQTGYGGGG